MQKKSGMKYHLNIYLLLKEKFLLENGIYMPSKLKEKLINSYTKNSLLATLNVLHHTHLNESMTYLIEYLINNIYNNDKTII